MTPEELSSHGYFEAFINNYFEEQYYSYYPDKIRLLYSMASSRKEKAKITKREIKKAQKKIQGLGFEEYSSAFLISKKPESGVNHIKPEDHHEFWLNRFAEIAPDYLVSLTRITDLYERWCEIGGTTASEFWNELPSSVKPQSVDLLAIIEKEHELLGLITYDVAEHEKTDCWEFDFDEYQEFTPFSTPLTELFKLSELFVQLNLLLMYQEFQDRETELVADMTEKALDNERAEIFKDKDGWIQWTTRNPELSEKRFPLSNSNLKKSIRKTPPYHTANWIQDLPKNLLLWRKEIEALTGIARQRKIEEQLELINGLLYDWKFKSEIENEAVKSIEDVLHEHLEYWTAGNKTVKNPVQPSLSMPQIALIKAYKGEIITRINAPQIASEYGYTAPNSGEALYQKFLKYYKQTDRKGDEGSEKKNQNKINRIESILEYLEPSELEKAKDEVIILKNIVDSYN